MTVVFNSDMKCRELKDMNHVQADEVSLTRHHAGHKHCGPKSPFLFLCCTILPSVVQVLGNAPWEVKLW